MSFNKEKATLFKLIIIHFKHFHNIIHYKSPLYVSPATHKNRTAKIAFFSDMYGLLSEFLSSILGGVKLLIVNTLQTQTHQSRQNHQQRDDFAADVLLLEAEDAVDEGNYETYAIQDERDDDHHGGILLQAGKVDDIGHGDEDRHRHDAPTPLERLFFPLRKPNQEEQHGHHQEVVDGVPRLDGRGRDALLAQEELVVDAAKSHQHCRSQQHIHPFVRPKTDTLQLARAVHEIEGNDGQNHANALQPRQALAKDQKHQDDRDGRPKLVDRPHHRDGQVLHGRVAEHPRTEDDGRLAQYEQVLPRRDRLDEELLHEVAGENIRLELRKQDKGQENQPADHGAVEQNGNDRIIDDGLFLEDVIKAQQEG